MSKRQTQASPKTFSTSSDGGCIRDISLGLTVSVFMIGAIALLSWATTLYTIANPGALSGMAHHQSQQR